MPLYYLTANKTHFHNSESLASLRLNGTWGGELISVDILKIAFLHVLFLYFYNGFTFREAYIWGVLSPEPLLC